MTRSDIVLLLVERELEERVAGCSSEIETQFEVLVPFYQSGVPKKLVNKEWSEKGRRVHVCGCAHWAVVMKRDLRTCDSRPNLNSVHSIAFAVKSSSTTAG